MTEFVMRAMFLLACASIGLKISDYRGLDEGLWGILIGLAVGLIFIALEINNAIVLLVTAALMANRNTTVIVATAITRLLLKKRCVWLAFVQLGRLNSDDETASW